MFPEKEVLIEKVKQEVNHLGVEDLEYMLKLLTALNNS